MSHNEFIGDPETALAAAKRQQKKAAKEPEYQAKMREAREARSAFTDQERAEAQTFMQILKAENALRRKKELETKLQALQDRKEAARNEASLEDAAATEAKMATLKAKVLRRKAETLRDSEAERPPDRINVGSGSEEEE